MVLALASGSAQAASGQLDTSFGFKGKVTTRIGAASNVSGIALQPDGKVLVVGSALIDGRSDFALARYRGNGSLDTSFGRTGRVVTSIGSRDLAFAVAVQRDGKIVVAGASDNGQRIEIAVARYTANGSLDSSFGSDGVVTTAPGDAYSAANAITIQSDGKIVVAGSTEWDFALVRYNPDGSLDNTFGMRGTVTTSIGGPRDRATSIAVQRDGKLVVAGRTGGYEAAWFALARYNRDGSLDTSFGRSGVVTTRVKGYDEAQALVLQADGKVLVAG